MKEQLISMLIKAFEQLADDNVHEVHITIRKPAPPKQEKPVQIFSPYRIKDWVLSEGKKGVSTRDTCRRFNNVTAEDVRNAFYLFELEGLGTVEKQPRGFRFYTKENPSLD